MNTVIFTIRCLHNAAEEKEKPYQSASEKIKRHFYVDYLLTGADTIQEKILLKRSVESSGFCLRKAL